MFRTRRGRRQHRNGSTPTDAAFSSDGRTLLVRTATGVSPFGVGSDRSLTSQGSGVGAVVVGTVGIPAD